MRTILFFFAFAHFLLNPANAQVKEDCFKEGECLRSMFVGSTVTDTREECHQLCFQNDPCQYFTYYAVDKDCLQFANCLDFSNTSCSNCFTGEKVCSLYTCFSKGQCQGIYVDDVHAENANECLEKCRDVANCAWFSYDDSDYRCTMLETCDDVDDTCRSCVNGQVECDRQKEYTKLFIVAGSNPASEIIDLESLDTNCRDPLNHPNGSLNGSVGLSLNDQPVVCGGGDPITNVCFTYDKVLNLWNQGNPMQEARKHATAVKVLYNEYWIMGGQRADRFPLSSTEIFKDGSFRSGPGMPEPMYGHCAVRINSTHVFVASGRDMDLISNETTYSGNTYLINLDTFEWTFLEPLEQPRGFSACGYIKTSSGAIEVVVAGGYNGSHILDTVDILSLTSLQWRTGPSYPTRISYSTTVQFEDYFLSTGGNTGEVLSNFIYQFDRDQIWTLKGRTMQNGRNFHVALAVADDFAICSKKK